MFILSYLLMPVQKKKAHLFGLKNTFPDLENNYTVKVQKTLDFRRINNIIKLYYTKGVLI